MTDWYRKAPRAIAPATKPRRKPAGALERPIQRTIIDLLEAMGFRVVAVPNASMLAGNAAQRARLISAMKRDGLRPGFPDLIVLGKVAGQIGLLEVKREIGGRLDPDQVEWRDFLLGVGHPWALVRGVDDTLDALRRWKWIAA